MRTNIDIDDDLMAAAMKATGTTTKKAAVEEAMRRTVRNEELKEALERLRGIGWDAPPSENRQFREDGTVYYPSDEK
ncbi:MAG TPA: type II toxin-antitoxin system VapB family antitoxin [Devosia sp.]|nr:type II toxin-antitoxin system VapB family antitoxin [Devosia sp.]